MNLFAKTNLAIQSKPALLRKHYNTHRQKSQSAATLNSRRNASENRHFDGQEFRGVPPELSDQQAQIAGEPAQAIVEFRIGKHFADGGGVVIQLRGGVRDVLACYLQVGVERVVGRQFAKRSFSSADIADGGVAVRHGLLGLVVQRRIIQQLSD